jgi:hypothetical protein
LAPESAGLESRCGSEVKWWNEKINEIKRSGFAPQPGQPYLKKESAGLDRYFKEL